MNNNPTTAEEQYELGRKYEEGDGVAKDLKLAKYWYTKAENQGSNIASFALGALMMNEEQTMKTCKGAGNEASERLVGDAMKQLSNKNYKEAVALFEKAAKLGHMGAQYALGDAYVNEIGVGKNYAKAARWFDKAAEQGHPWAQRCLGAHLYYGQGVPKDKIMAIYWFSKAAEQGDKKALDILDNFDSDAAQKVRKKIETSVHEGPKSADMERKERERAETIKHDSPKSADTERKERERKEKEDEKRREKEELEKWKQEHPEEWEKIKRKAAKNDRIFFPLGMIMGGAWFAFIDIALDSPSVYGGYWSVIGIHVLLSVILSLIFIWVGCGSANGFKSNSGCGLLFILPILAFPLGLLAGVINIGWSLAIGVILGFFMGAGACGASEEFMLTSAKRERKDS